MRVPAAIVLTLIMIVAVIASPGNPANATSGGAVSAGTVFGADQSIGQVSTSDQTESTYQPVHISDEYALQKIEQTFGPEVAASLNYRANQDHPVSRRQSYKGYGSKYRQLVRVPGTGS
jgi:hypothetical protein